MSANGEEKVEIEKATPLLVSLLSGGTAGLVVDTALYPLDTIKTRLQSSQGFVKAGGFRGVYNGLNVAMTGSAPASALFFVTYNTLKQHLQTNHQNVPTPVTHMVAACSAEIPACLVRVPTEVIKQRMQAHTGSSQPRVAEVIRSIISANGFAGLYRGFGVTIMREIPFSFIQFPLYEYWKKVIAQTMNRECSEFEAACVGSVSGGIAAAATTPLDVLKTRLMLGVDSKGVAYVSASDVLQRLVKEEGWKKLFSGITPRVTWISIGGFVYFGAYNYSRSIYMKF